MRQSENTYLSSRQPKLIFSPADVSMITESDLDRVSFENPQYEEIAQLLQKLSILERNASTNLRAWLHDTETHGELSQEVGDGLREIRNRLHDIFLEDHTYPNGPQMILVPTDVREHQYSQDALRFRDEQMENIARSIEMIATFELELERHLVTEHGYSEGEREAMIKNTLTELNSQKDHLTKILTGYYTRKNRAA